MTKDEALKMAIEEIEGWIDHAYGHSPEECADNKTIMACREALEPTVAELNDEYLRDTHVEGLNKPRIALEKATKAWYDVDLTGQTNLECARNWFIEGYVQALEFPPKAKTQQPTKEEILGKVFDAVYAQYQPKAETHKPVDVEKIKKEAKQTLADLIEMNTAFAKTHGKPMYIHLWSLANGLTFDLREPNPETMVMEYYLGAIELNQHTELAFATKQLDYNKLARSCND